MIGYNLCQEMQTAPVLFLLTSRADEADKIRGFSDDYLTNHSLELESDWERF